MKFRIEVKHKTGDPSWWETFDEEKVISIESGRAWAEKTIKWFNDTLRKGEAPRLFTGRIELLSDGTKKHQWRKQSVMTKEDHRGAFDILECERCHARARRYGLLHIKMQRPFTTKKYKTCPGDAK